MSKKQLSHNRKGCREILKAVADAGGEVLDVAVLRRKRHYKITIRTPIGPRFIIAAASASDWRAMKNLQSNVKRLLRATPEPRPARPG
jgi:hypothetical protein